MGAYFPAFYLTNSNGDVISRWTGFTTVASFISSLRAALSDLTTIKKQEQRFAANPSYRDALALAKYHADTDQFLKAIEYYREAQKLSPSPFLDYSFVVFENAVNAAWNERLSFPEVLSFADTILIAARRNPTHVKNVAKYMSKLARKLGTTDQIGKYLKAGIEVTAGSQVTKEQADNAEFRADYALYIDGNAAEAIRIKKSSLNPGWETEPKSYYNFARWCLAREINLPEAESLARRAAQLASGGPFKAKNLNTVAEICFAQDKVTEAIEITQQAAELDPDNDFYAKQLQRFQQER